MPTLMAKTRRISSVVGVFLVLLALVWYFGFNRKISLPSQDRIKRIEVCQNDFKQRAQLITYIEEQPRIQKIYDFIDQRKKGWEPRLYSPAAPVVTADFYGPDGILLELYLMKSSTCLIRNGDGVYMKSLRNEERNEFFGLLGVSADQMVSNHFERKF